MLRKRGREMQEQFKVQLMASLASDSFFSSNALAAAAFKKIRSSPFFSVPGFFGSLAGKGSSDSDSMRSPISPLDHWFFSGVGTSYVHSPRSPGRSWDCSRVGLGLLDTLRDDPESKNILVGAQMKTNHVSRPKTTHLNSVGDGISLTRSLFSQLASNEKIESCCPTDKPREIYYNSKSNSDVFASDSKSSQVGPLPSIRGRLDSKRWNGSLPVSVDSIHGFMGSLSSSEIELSEDYTCIISHGPNPKTTHIFGDCIFENYMMESLDSNKNKQEGEGGDSHWIVESSENSPPLPSNDFLSFCFACKKKLEEGNDIYMYRGVKPFCSCSCRDLVILSEEEVEMEKPETCSGDSPTCSSFHEDLFIKGMVLSA